MNPSGPIRVPVLIFGGGIAGLWLLDELARSGREPLLLEANDLGQGQTIASQGIVHGGLKYTLEGLLTSSARAIRDMPLLWRRSLAGECEPDLSGTRLRAEFCHLWRTKSLRSRLGMIGARAGLRIGPKRISPDERPPALRHCPGTVARLDEQVLEPSGLLSRLADLHPRRLLQIDYPNGLEIIAPEPGRVQQVRLIEPSSGKSLDFHPDCVVLTAGAGNADLRLRCGLEPDVMQRRPLHMIMARGSLPALNGHCVDGRRTRVTITSIRDYADRIVWQIGGQLSEDGVRLEPSVLIDRAIAEIKSVVPGLDLRGVEWTTYRVDRAEPSTPGGGRPESISVRREGNVITAWPTKMALAPVMVDAIIDVMPPDLRATESIGFSFDWPRPSVAIPPWEDTEQWITVD